jgi:hypothetical protein
LVASKPALLRQGHKEVVECSIWTVKRYRR